MKIIILVISLLIITVNIAGCGNNTGSAATLSPTPWVDDIGLHYYSEEELISAIKQGDNNGTYSAGGIEFYFKPAALPEGAYLAEIQVKDSYISFTYRLDKDSGHDSVRIFVLLWERAMTAGDLKKELHKTGKIESLKNSNQYYWSKAARLNDKGEWDESLAQEIYVSWEQDGYVFNALAPVSFTEEDIEKYCNAVKVIVE